MVESQKKKATTYHNTLFIANLCGICWLRRKTYLDTARARPWIYYHCCFAFSPVFRYYIARQTFIEIIRSRHALNAIITIHQSFVRCGCVWFSFSARSLDHPPTQSLDYLLSIFPFSLSLFHQTDVASISPWIFPMPVPQGRGFSLATNWLFAFNSLRHKNILSRVKSLLPKVISFRTLAFQ